MTESKGGILSAEEPQLAYLAPGVGNLRYTQTGVGQAFLGAC